MLPQRVSAAVSILFEEERTLQNSTVTPAGLLAAGVSLSSTGFNVYVLNRSTNVISVYRNLPQESVWSLLSTNGSKNPVVYLHWPLDQPDVSNGCTRQLTGCVADVLTRHLNCSSPADQDPRARDIVLRV